MSSKLPVTLVTGFLGSGKTTIISHLIESLPELRLAVLVSEFGSVSIDDQLLADKVQNENVEIFEVGRQLVTDGNTSQLEEEFEKIWAKRNLFDQIIFETSGLSHPASILALIESANLKERFVVDATLAVVDTPLLLTKAFDNEASQVLEAQLKNSDVVVLNKIDELLGEQLLQAEALVRGMASQIRFVELAKSGAIDPKLAMGLRLNLPAHELAAHHRPFALAPGLGNGHSHSGLAAHDHGLHTHEHLHEHDPGWISFVITSHEPVQPEALCACLRELAQAQPLLRVKGFVSAASAQTYLIQGVRERINFALRSEDAVSAHEHSHSHEHEHEQEHSHTHRREHEHAHEHSHTDRQEHEHAHEHSHTHRHEHEHAHEHEHSHTDRHEHEHAYEYEHSHVHSHSHEHEHLHTHEHEHEHSPIHSHGHTHSHAHDHMHEHEHAHEHKHEHEHLNNHEHTHGHKADSQLVLIGYHLDRNLLTTFLNDSGNGHWH